MPILPPPKYTDTTLKATSRLRGRGQACNPSSSKVPAVVADEAAGLGVWRACLPTPNQNTQPINAQPNTYRWHLTCTSNVWSRE